jgi:hypothetical protein
MTTGYEHLPFENRVLAETVDRLADVLATVLEERGVDPRAVGAGLMSKPIGALDKMVTANTGIFLERLKNRLQQPPVRRPPN